MNENIAVVGAGICGLCTALALAAKGNQVTIYERDIPPPEGDVDQAFFEWKRRGAAQFRHPHAFLAVMCNLLEQRYPDLIEEFWRVGARKISFRDMLSEELLEDYVPEPEDESMWLLMCRRATMETTLRRYVESAHGVSINNQHNITGIKTESIGNQVRITGLCVSAEREAEQTVQHDLIIDASGRTTRFPEWFSEVGVTFETEDDDADIVYYTRHFKLNPGIEEPARNGKDRSAGDLGYIKYGVFPGDNGHFAVILCLPNLETELKEAVKVPEMFDAICHEIPGLRPWVNTETATPTTASFGFGDIHAVWRHFLKKGEPQALNYFAVGDAAIRTNPLYGRGCSTGILHAHILADVIAEETDPAERARVFDARSTERLRPIFNASLREDKQGIKRAKAIFEGRDMIDAPSFSRWLKASFIDAVGAAAREDIHVIRGALRTFNLMEQPGEFLKDGKTRLKVLRYFFRGRSKNNAGRLQRGPRREELLQTLQSHQEVELPQN